MVSSKIQMANAASSAVTSDRRCSRAFALASLILTASQRGPHTLQPRQCDGIDARVYDAVTLIASLQRAHLL
jgi:hypothetical protein